MSVTYGRLVVSPGTLISSVNKPECHNYNWSTGLGVGLWWLLPLLAIFELSGIFFFFSYLTDFSYFPLKIVFRKLLDNGQNMSKMTILKGGVVGFSYFSLISVILFSNRDHFWVISWWSVLLVEETEVQGENHRPVLCHWQTLSHTVVSITPCHEQNSNFTDDRHWLHR